MMRLLGAVIRPAFYMGMAREAAAEAVAVTELPFSTRSPDWVTVELSPTPAGAATATAGTVGTPVLLVHGYGGTATVWELLARRLRDAGFSSLHMARYNTFRLSVRDAATRLVQHVQTTMEDTGSPVVHLVGHSLGGLVARYAVQCPDLEVWCLGMAGHTSTVATIATPHRGSPLAHLGRGPSAVDLRPGSATLAALAATPPPAGVRWVTYYSGTDLAVPADAAVLDDPSFGASNVLVPEVGHLSIVRSSLVAGSLVHQLLASERGQVGVPDAELPAPAAITGHLTAGTRPAAA
ncbi:MAG: esterase/lipase family protein [Pseudonocardiaceae bacterium]